MLETMHKAMLFTGKLHKTNKTKHDFTSGNLTVLV